MNERDEAAVKEAIKEMDSRLLRDIVKDAVKELVGDYVRLFGWWSMRTLSVAAAGGVLVLILWAAGYVKADG